MTPLRARVQNGGLRLDQPTGLAEGTELDLVIDDEGDDLTEHERQGTARDALEIMDVRASGQAPSRRRRDHRRASA